jgi:hypothetical protein
MKKTPFIALLLVQSIFTFGQTLEITTYVKKPKLEWSEFKGENIGDDTLKGFNFYCTLQMKTLKVNVWTGVTSFKAYGIYYPTKSWILTTKKSDQLLSYFQLQFDISNAMGTQLEKEINAKRINGGNKNKMEKVFKAYETRLNNILQKMDMETHYGKNINEIKKWHSKLKSGSLEY